MPENSRKCENYVSSSFFETNARCVNCDDVGICKITGFHCILETTEAQDAEN